jgi:hypothetical protein
MSKTASCFTRIIPRPVRKRIERPLHIVLPGFLKPSFWSEFLDVVSPHARIAMDCIARNTEHCTGREGLARHCHRYTVGYDSRQPNTARGMAAKSLVDDRIKIGQLLHSLEGRRRILAWIQWAQRFIKLCLKLALAFGILCQIVGDCA